MAYECNVINKMVGSCTWRLIKRKEETGRQHEELLLWQCSPYSISEASWHLLKISSLTTLRHHLEVAGSFTHGSYVQVTCYVILEISYLYG